MTMTHDDVRDVLRDMGQIRLSLITSEILKSPLAPVLRLENVRSAAGLRPCEGRDWLYVTEPWRVSLGELKDNPLEAVVALFRERRAIALVGLVKKLEGVFDVLCGSLLRQADPRDFGMIVLEGEWLREVYVPTPFQPSVVTAWIDCTFAFVPKELLPPPGQAGA